MTVEVNPTIILDPTDEREPINRSQAKRSEHITGTIRGTWVYYHVSI